MTPSVDELVHSNRTLAENAALALASYVPRLRSNGQRVAARELDELSRLFDRISRELPGTAPSCQELTNEQANGGAAHTGQVPLAHDYPGAATRIGVSVRTVHRLVAQGQLKALSVRRRRLIAESELARYLNEGA